MKLRSKRWRLNSLYKIVTKSGKLITFRFNEEQEILFNKYQESRKSIGNIREYILKSRQVGITTFHCLYYLDEVIFNTGRTAAIVAHERDSLERIFRKIKLAWENLPAALKPSASTENKRELVFDSINSNIYVSLKTRSGTINHLHVSEIAYIREYSELKSGSFQSAAAGDITCETTGNGYNAFYSDWCSAKSGRVWGCTYLPWTIHPEYVSDIVSDRNDHDEYLSSCTQEQKNWWYRKLDEIGVQSRGTDPVDFLKQEYPISEHDAFITSGNSIFVSVINKPEELHPIDPDPSVMSELIETDLSGFVIYEAPIDGHRYVVGADVASGYGKDFSCLYVIDNKTFNICAEWHGRVAEDIFGSIIGRIGFLYNTAVVAPEVNFQGQATLNELKNDYPDIYTREVRDRILNEETTRMGWVTTEKTKLELISQIIRELTNGDISAIPETLRNEMRTFVLDENGSVGAQSGCNDDRVMAFGITLMVLKSNLYYSFETKRGKYMGR